VNLLIGSMTPTQREAMKAGVNPLDPVAVLRFADALNRLSPLAMARDFETGNGRGRPDYGPLEIVKLLNEPAMAGVIARAEREGLGWIKGQHDLLRLGPGAVAALVDAKMKDTTFDTLKSAGYEAKDAVAFSRFAIETGKDVNEVGPAAAKVTGALPSTEAEAHRQAMREYVNAVVAKNAAEREVAAKKLTEIHQRAVEQNPGMSENVENLNKQLGLKADEQAKATNSAAAKDAGATTKEVKAAGDETKLAAAIVDEWGEPNKPSNEAKPDAQQAPANHKSGEGQKQPERPHNGKTKIARAGDAKRWRLANGM